MVRTIDFSADLDRIATRPVQTEHVLYYSTDLRERLRVTVTQGGTPVSMATQTISATALLADGSTIISGFETEKEVDGTGIVAVILPAAVYAVPGTVTITIYAADGSGHPLALLAVQARVLVTESESVIDPGDVLPSVTELREIIAEAESTITTLTPRVEALERAALTFTDDGTGAITIA